VFGTQPDHRRVVEHRLLGLGQLRRQIHELLVGRQRQQRGGEFLGELPPLGVVCGNKRGQQGGKFRRPLLARERHDLRYVGWHA